MSRHLLIRCDRAGCAEQTETRASDTEPTSIQVPEHWLTLHQNGSADRHYCSLPCLVAAHQSAAASTPTPPAQPVTHSPYAAPVSVAPEPEKPATRSRKK